MSLRYTVSFLLLAAAPGFAGQVAQTSLPAFFIYNAGQADPSIRYMVDTPGLNAGFTATAAVFQLDGLTLQVRFLGANPHLRIEGEQRLNAAANFLLGNRPEGWKTDLPTYQKILYRNLYPGIDMTYGGAGHRIKSEFLVAPGADPAQIRLEYSSSNKVRLSIEPNGDLLVRGDHAEAREEAPAIFQNGVSIPGRYILLDAHTVGFEIGAFDSTQPLLIDPVLSYATYLGGTGMTAVTGLAVDSSGDLYATGWTESLNFQIAAPIQASNAGSVNAFVLKLNPAGTSLIYATYIGGNGTDRGEGIAVDSSGEAYVAGSTGSANFPLASPVISKLGGGEDAFALKINASGNLLLYSTYLGGTSTDYGYAVAVDSSGDAYIAGDTTSANFPVSSGVAQSAFGGIQNVFVTKLTPTGAISYSTFLGGSGVDHAGGIALDATDNAYVAGGTTSTNFPTHAPIQAANGGYQDAFLTKISSNGAQFLYSTYLGGNGGGFGVPEEANAVAVDSSGNAYIAGTANSTNFPVTSGTFQTQFEAVQDAFVAKVNPAGNALVYCTLLGGSVFNSASAIAVGAGGIAYVDGYTSSPDFPTVNPTQAALSGLYGAFVSVFNSAGTALSFSTFFGGSGMDAAYALAVDGNGDMYIGGQTSSVNLPTLDPIQATNTGEAIGWLARLAAAAAPPPPTFAMSVSPGSGSGLSQTFTFTFTDTNGYADMKVLDILINTSLNPVGACYFALVPATATSGYVYLVDNASDGGYAAGTPILAPSSNSVSNSQCTIGGNGTLSGSGNTLTVTVPITFSASFSGTKEVNLAARSSTQNSGWEDLGTWTVPQPAPPAPPTPPAPPAPAGPGVQGVTPSQSTSSGETFTFSFTDSSGWQSLDVVDVLISNALNGVGACYFAYVPASATSGSVYLLNDALTGYVAGTPMAIPGTGSLENSQCTINVSGSSATASGDVLNVNLAITFSQSFAGNQTLYLAARDHGTGNSGWQASGGVDIP